MEYRKRTQYLDAINTNAVASVLLFLSRQALELLIVQKFVLVLEAPISKILCFRYLSTPAYIVRQKQLKFNILMSVPQVFKL